MRKCFLLFCFREQPTYTAADFYLVFNETEPLIPDEVMFQLTDFDPLPVFGRNWSLVADYGMFITEYKERKIKVEDYYTPYVSTTRDPNRGKVKKLF